MSTLAFNITQFFSLLNSYLLLLILRKARCNSKIYHFFSNYLVGRKTWYCWNSFSSQFFNVNVSVEQGSALSSILPALYISLVFYVAQSKSLTISNSFLFYSYNIVSLLLKKFGLILEHGKIEVFHFSRSCRTFNSSSLNLSVLEGFLLLQSQDLRVGQVKEPYIGLTQENSIENSVQNCLPYIQILNGLCELFLAYPK